MVSIFRRILGYLNLYGMQSHILHTESTELFLVESDYTVVFFAAGGRYTPGWNWVWKAYRSLSRKYRKNLKRLVRIFFTFYHRVAHDIRSTSCTPRSFLRVGYESEEKLKFSDNGLVLFSLAGAIIRFICYNILYNCHAQPLIALNSSGRLLMPLLCRIWRIMYP